MKRSTLIGRAAATLLLTAGMTTLALAQATAPAATETPAASSTAPADSASSAGAAAPAAESAAAAAPATQVAAKDRPFVYDPGDYATAEEHYNALKQAAGDAANASPEFAQLPDWSGLWTRNLGAEGFSVRPGEKRTGVGYQTEIGMKLTPEYQAKYDQMIADFQAGKGDFDPLTLCLPSGYPRWHVEPFLKEFLVRPELTMLINEQQSEARRVYTDGRGHVPEELAYPMWTGDSIGFWNDQTLTIWTNNNKANIYQRQQPEHSDAVETVEEWTEIEDGVMEVKMTIYDEKALQEPFPLIRYYYQIDDQNGDLRVAMWSCNENQNAVQTADGNTDFVLPGEAGYKTPVGNSTVDALAGGASGNSAAPAAN